VDLVERPRQPAPKEVLKTWAREWAKEGVKVDWQHLLPPKGFQVLPRRWIVERTFSWALLHYNGFTIAQRYGDWKGEPLTAAGRSIIVVCRKRA
jgi:transposase